MFSATTLGGFSEEVAIGKSTGQIVSRGRPEHKSFGAAKGKPRPVPAPLQHPTPKSLGGPRTKPARLPAPGYDPPGKISAIVFRLNERAVLRTGIRVKAFGIKHLRSLDPRSLECFVLPVGELTEPGTVPR